VPSFAVPVICITSSATVAELQLTEPRLPTVEVRSVNFRETVPSRLIVTAADQRLT
jgi:hypothetical protein